MVDSETLWIAAALVLGVLATAVAAAATACCVWMSRPRLPKQAPRGALATPFQGELREQAFLKVFQDMDAKTCEAEGFVITCDPKLVRELMTKSKHTEHRSRFYTLSRYVLYGMDGILSMDGKVWERHKEALYPLFHAGNVDLAAMSFYKAMARHADAWQRGVQADDGVLADDAPAAGPGTHDLVAACRAAGLEALVGFAMSMKPEDPSTQELMRLLTQYGKHLAGIADGVGGAFALPLGVWRVTACTNAIRRAVTGAMVARFEAPTLAEASETMRAAVRRLDGDAAKRDGLRAMWLAGFGANETAAEVNHVYGAHKAAGYSIACMLWRLSRPENRAWVRHLRAEWAAELGKPGADAPDGARTAAPLHCGPKRLPVTHAVIDEATRLHVVSLCTGRQTGLPVTIDGVTLPPGTEVGVALQAMHTHPDHFSDPSEFRPERFLPDSHPLRGDATADPKAFLPFLSGPRKCAGMILAKMEHVTGLHAVLDRYDIETDDAAGTKSPRMRADLYSSHEKPISFRCEPRCDD